MDATSIDATSMDTSDAKGSMDTQGSMETQGRSNPAQPLRAPEASGMAAQAEAAPPDGMLAQVTPRQVVLATITILSVAAAFWMAWQFRYVLFALVAAVFLHIAMKPAVEALYRRGVGRRLGVVIVYVVLLVAVLALLLTIVPMLAQQASAFMAQLPDYYRLVRNYMLQSSIDLLPRLARLLPPAWNMAGVQEIVVESAQGSAATATTSPWLLVGQIGKSIFFTIAVFAMAFYLTLDRDRLLYNLLLRLPLARRDPTRELVGEIEMKVGAFIQGQLILCSVIGALSLVAYLLIGLPYAVALGAMAFVFEAIPLIGPLLAAVAAGIVAATVGPDKLLWVLVASAVIQMAENNVLVPRVMDKTVGVNAIVSILAITAFTLMFGILGALLAIPLAAVIQIAIDRYVFSAAQAADLETEALAPQSEGGTRGEIDLLRLQAAELAQDVRKPKRDDEAETSPEVEPIEDLMEMAASELVALLSPLPANETKVASTAGAPVPQVGVQMGTR